MLLGIHHSVQMFPYKMVIIVNYNICIITIKRIIMIIMIVIIESNARAAVV